MKTSDDRLEEIRRRLDGDDELRYEALARELGPDALPALRRLVDENDPRFASGAAFLAGLIAAPDSPQVVRMAAQSEHAVVRVAAAAAVRRLAAHDATGIARELLGDRDAGVRGHAIRSAMRLGGAALLARVKAISKEDPEPAVRQLARRELACRPGEVPAHGRG